MFEVSHGVLVGGHGLVQQHGGQSLSVGEELRPEGVDEFLPGLGVGSVVTAQHDLLLACGHLDDILLAQPWR